jgi:serine phosphatase RsbU (regulator of sigma subunit)
MRLRGLENKRKDKELEEAREFQLKMIAKKIPDYAGMNIKAYMRTSTEVGGDYYDFFETEDGSFYVVCGDATGHGAQSGMMVSITKAGLAGIVSNSPDDILSRLNSVVRRVDTGRLRMSLSVCIFRDNKLFISAAAMPPAYLYSARTKKVEEIEIHNLPLGGLDNEQFDLVERNFKEGDLLVILSDGLPEAPNPGGALLDYPAVQQCVEKTGHLGASPVKEALIKLADEWLDGTQTPDDITFVVLEKNNSTEQPQKIEPAEQIKKVAQA